MGDRLEELVYSAPTEESTKESLETSLFLTQPGEFMVEQFVTLLKADAAWSTLFGDVIDSYDRMDYSQRELPAIRCYVEHSRKDYDSWFEDGEVKIDIIWPASIRRKELQRLPSTVAGAMLQQLRRAEFFISMCDKIPGLNEFGKRVTKDLSLGFAWQEGVIPLTQITANFRIDLREWDLYLESDNRTTGSPFVRSLEDLAEIRATIDALESNDPDDVNITTQVIVDNLDNP